MDEDLIIFDDTEAYLQRIQSMEHTIRILTDQLKEAQQEIASLRTIIYDHINFFHDTETRSRFHIAHVHKINTYQNPVYTSSSESTDTLPTEGIIIDI